MNKTKIILTTLLTLMLLLSAFCTGTDSTNNNTSDDNNMKVTVSSAVELFNEIGSNKTIMLKDGEYILSEELLEQVDNDNVIYDEYIYGYTIINVENLKIIGASKEGTQLLTETSHIPVLSFEESSNIELSNITAGHIAEVDYCMGCVLSFSICTDVTITNTDLFGSGLFGFYIDGTENFNFNKSSVYGCSDDILIAVGSNNVKITESVFTDNRGSFIIGECNDVLIKDSSITNNSGDNPLFLVSSYEGELEPIKIETSIIKDNSYPMLEQEEGSVIIDDKTEVTFSEYEEDM